MIWLEKIVTVGCDGVGASLNLIKKYRGPAAISLSGGGLPMLCGGYRPVLTARTSYAGHL